MTDDAERTLRQLEAGHRSPSQGLLALAECNALPALTSAARRMRDEGHGSTVSYSPKVFIPLTRLCRDVCHYCTFATAPQAGQAGYLAIDEMIAIARRGAEAGCHEALFTLGDKPELRYPAAAAELARLGHDTTVSYLAEAARRVHGETGLLPHLNPGVLTPADLVRLRPVAVSMGLMLESVADRLCDKGGPHYRSPDKRPAVRIRCVADAGKLDIPFTTGILIGIGESRIERIEALIRIRELHESHGHIQEVIIQNFRPKPRTAMARAPAASTEELVWTIAVARLILGPEMNIQAPPNLSAQHLQQVLGAGINDWGGISPVTCDHVNPEAPWPALDALRQVTGNAGKQLVPRLAIYPRYAGDPGRWLDRQLVTSVIRRLDSQGLVRDTHWFAGRSPSPPKLDQPRTPRGQARSVDREMGAILNAARDGTRLSEDDIVRLFQARGAEFDAVCEAANALRSEVSGDVVSYVVTRNINYTNLCRLHCGFCAFSKGRLHEKLRGRPYDLSLEEVARRTREAWERGATEVCLQGGIHPDYDGRTYLALCAAVKEAAPNIHVHAFSPQEVWHGAGTLGLSLGKFLAELKAVGLGSLPGTAAEILDDEVRAVLCSDKITTAQWLEVMETAHGLGLATTSTIMFGHVERPVHWARHLLRVRDLQCRTRGFTEFVPLPFVHMEAPIFLRGQARQGPTFREAVLMHAIARLALHPAIVNIQTSWVKMGEQGAQACLAAGANDLGGTLMNESITRAAGSVFGQELPPPSMERLITGLGRVPCQRTTRYGEAPAERRISSFEATPLTLPLEQPARKAKRRAQEIARCD